jgi:hypothetical protein
MFWSDLRDLFSSLGKVLPTFLLSESYLPATYLGMSTPYTWGNITLESNHKPIDPST